MNEMFVWISLLCSSGFVVGEETSKPFAIIEGEQNQLASLGSSFQLNCTVKNMKQNPLKINPSWYRNGVRLRESDFPDGKNGTRLRFMEDTTPMEDKVIILTMLQTLQADSGVYTCMPPPSGKLASITLHVVNKEEETSTQRTTTSTSTTSTTEIPEAMTSERLEYTTTYVQSTSPTEVVQSTSPTEVVKSTSPTEIVQPPTLISASISNGISLNEKINYNLLLFIWMWLTFTIV